MRSSRRTIIRTALAAMAAAVSTPIATQLASAQTAGKKPMTTASGLQIIDSKEGTGATPKTGQTCVMHYTGWLYENGQKGKKFELFGRPQRAVRIQDRHAAGYRRLG